MNNNVKKLTILKSYVDTTKKPQEFVTELGTDNNFQKVTIQIHPDDEINQYIGTALCIAKFLAGSNTKFKEIVNKTYYPPKHEYIGNINGK